MRKDGRKEQREEGREGGKERKPDFAPLKPFCTEQQQQKKMWSLLCDLSHNVHYLKD